MLLKKTSSKNVQLWKYLVMKLSFIFECQLAFNLILGDPFMVSPPKVWGTFFQKKLFMGMGDKF